MPNLKDLIAYTEDYSLQDGKDLHPSVKTAVIEVSDLLAFLKQRLGGVSWRS